MLDVDEPAIDDRVRRPSLALRTEGTLAVARLRAEREAIAAVAPEAVDRLRRLDLQLRLEAVAERPSAARGLGLSR